MTLFPYGSYFQARLSLRRSEMESNKPKKTIWSSSLWLQEEEEEEEDEEEEEEHPKKN